MGLIKNLHWKNIHWIRLGEIHPHLSQQVQGDNEYVVIQQKKG